MLCLFENNIYRRNYIFRLRILAWFVSIGDISCNNIAHLQWLWDRSIINCKWGLLLLYYKSFIVLRFALSWGVPIFKFTVVVLDFFALTRVLLVQLTLLLLNVWVLIVSCDDWNLLLVRVSTALYIDINYSAAPLSSDGSLILVWSTHLIIWYAVGLLIFRLLGCLKILRVFILSNTVCRTEQANLCWSIIGNITGKI